MEAILIKIAWGLVGKLLTERLFSNMLIHGVRAWSDKTENVHDDRVVDAMAEALGVDSKALKVMSQESGK